jgi:hypothetical protein
MTLPIDEAGPPAAPPGPACRGCRGTEFRTSWQRFKDGTRHVRMDCAGCRRFVRYLKQADGPDFRFEPRKAGAHAAELAPPAPSWVWVGHVRQADEVWRPVALSSTLAGCWEALLTFPGEGDRLCIPSRPEGVAA